MRTFWKIEMDYISVREVAQKWEIFERRVQKLCEESRIDGIKNSGVLGNKAGEMLCITRSLKHL